ncbi:MAG: matrixin family metalloprotease [Nocardioidaceae bacterium]|nr:matrixin family metalloprotease [Nocardioidaceae bacterium]
MERPTPDADDLGVSEVEYERILRDLHRRGHVDAPPPPVVAAPAPGRRRPKRWLSVAVGALVGVFVLAPLLRTAHQDAPAYAFLDTVDGQPVTYSSCSHIQVAVYPAGGPPGAEQLVREAVTQVRAVTGLDIVVIGSFAGHAANWNFETAQVRIDDPITVSWQDGAALAAMTDEVAGLGGSPRINSSGGTQRYVAGTIALSRDYYASLARRGDHAEELAVLLHEFGHVFGLAHVDSPGELMYRKNIGRKVYGPGDLEGLRRLGRGPCS